MLNLGYIASLYVENFEPISSICNFHFTHSERPANATYCHEFLKNLRSGISARIVSSVFSPMSLMLESKLYFCLSSGELASW